MSKKMLSEKIGGKIILTYGTIIVYL